MRTINALLGASVLYIFLIPQALAAPPGGHLNIEEVAVTIGDTDTTLVINGYDFDFGSPLEVTLAGVPVTITSSSGVSITAIVPNSQFGAGDYLLTVSTGTGQSQNDEYDLTIGAVGPAGPAGADGVDGADGAPGLPGADSTVAGPVGPTGADGKDGSPGMDGADGADGVDGLLGPPGTNGENGEVGPPGPGVSLAGMRCPANHFMVGFDAESGLICESVEGAPPNAPTINCIIDYSQGQAEAIATPLLQSLFDDLGSINIDPIIGSFEGIPYVITPGSITANGQLSLSAPLVEVTSAEPCDDAIAAEIDYQGTVELPGEWSVTLPILGGITGEFLVTISGISAEVLVALLNPDISGVTVPTEFDRAVESVTQTDFQVASFTLSATGFQQLGDDLISIFVPFLQTQIETLFNSAMSDVVGNSIVELQPIFEVIPPPVVIQVIP